MNQEQVFIQLLKQAEERVTAPRLAVFRVLLETGAVGLPAIITRAQASGVHVVSTYRIMDLFQQLGFVTEVGHGRNRLFELSDLFGRHHHHFRCNVCGQMTDFAAPEVEAALQSAGQRMGVEIVGHTLDVSGTCAQCRVSVH